MRDRAAYWIDLCDYDLETAKAMLITGRYLYVGFMCHQVVEKSLKAVIAEGTNEIPPKTHDLVKLANMGGLWDSLSDEQKELFKKLIPLQIEARYPEYKERIAGTLTREFCDKMLTETEGFLCWIKTRLEK